MGITQILHRPDRAPTGICTSGTNSRSKFIFWSYEQLQLDDGQELKGWKITCHFRGKSALTVVNVREWTGQSLNKILKTIIFEDYTLWKQKGDNWSKPLKSHRSVWTTRSCWGWLWNADIAIVSRLRHRLLDWTTSRWVVSLWKWSVRGFLGSQ
jgi:hypothetical protein